MKKICFLFLSALFLVGNNAFARTEVSVEVTQSAIPLMEGHLKMGNPGPEGKEIIVNNKYLTIGGEPVIPVMGELHFSRVAKEEWRDRLLKMKANGINIVATYIFWIHHEEAEGIFEWEDNKDFRAFAKLCEELDFMLYPRVGPWCHGEVRNGATPDWILKKDLLVNRTNDPVYQAYVVRYFKEIIRQMDGLLYKDGGPVIGVQLENEYWRGQGGEAHILWLKQTVRELGLDVPMYTVTGWGNVSVPEDEVVPLFGDYPEEPWKDNVTQPSNNKPFFFDTNRDSEAIGNEQLKKDGKYAVDLTRYPYLTCELGVGNQLSYHRRPILDKLDGLAIATVKVGSGSNLPGYYVFTGGTNPQSKFTPMQEDQHETGMYNEYPKMSYDFQAAITETGELAQSYYEVKKLHYFLSEFGNILAPYSPSFPESGDRSKNLEFSVRSNGKNGFLFVSNYVRGEQRPLFRDITFNVKLEDGSSLKFPSSGINIPDSAVFIFPFNFDLNGVNLKYATAQPLANPLENVWVFFSSGNINPEFTFDDPAIESVVFESVVLPQKNGIWRVSDIPGGIGQLITVKLKDGSSRKLYVLSEKEALQSWIFYENGKKYFYLSNADLTLDNGNLNITYRDDFYLASLDQLPEITAKNLRKNDSAESNGWNLAAYEGTDKFEDKLTLKEKSLFADAESLVVNVDNITLKQQLWHRFFFKEFGLYNSAEIRSASLYIYADIAPEVRINNKYINPPTESKKLNMIDITGYVSKGENLLQIGFPFVTEKAAVTAVMEIIFHNNQRVLLNSGSDWLFLDQYVAPAPWTSVKGKAKPSIIADVKELPDADFKSYGFHIPYDSFGNTENLYLHVDYSGDEGEAYLGQKLVWDNMNNGTSWKMNLTTYRSLLEANSIDIVIKPLSPDARIRLDKEIGREPTITGYEIIPEYRTTVSVK